jgi:hydrogenase expression/formation protein HypC
MCLAIPGKIESIDGRTALVDFSGIKRRADLSFLPDAAVADWVLVHVGFAIQKVREDVARETYRLLDDSRKEELENEIRQE